MSDWTYLLFIPVLLGIVWFWPDKKPVAHSSKSGLQSNDRRPEKTSSEYHSVSIQPCAQACYAVLQLDGKRFLASEAATLPLMKCDAKQCTCTYRHHTDRRTQTDRRHDSIVMMNVYAKGEHRTGMDRRRQHAF